MKKNSLAPFVPSATFVVPLLLVTQTPSVDLGGRLAIRSAGAVGLEQAGLLQHDLRAFLVHRLQRAGGETDGDEPLFFRDVDALLLKVGVLAALRLFACDTLLPTRGCAPLT
jgi:hypothetical protein